MTNIKTYYNINTSPVGVHYPHLRHMGGDIFLRRISLGFSPLREFRVRFRVGVRVRVNPNPNPNHNQPEESHSNQSEERIPDLS